MRSVDCYTFLTVSVITTGFQARTVIFVFILLTKFRCKFFLQSQPLDTVSLMKFYHCIQFFLVPFQSSCYYSASISTIPHFLINYDLLLTLLYFIAYRKDSIFYKTCRLGTACNARCPQMASSQKGSWRQPAQGKRSVPCMIWSRP